MKSLSTLGGIQSATLYFGQNKSADVIIVDITGV